MLTLGKWGLGSLRKHSYEGIWSVWWALQRMPCPWWSLRSPQPCNYYQDCNKGVIWSETHQTLSASLLLVQGEDKDWLKAPVALLSGEGTSQLLAKAFIFFLFFCLFFWGINERTHNQVSIYLRGRTLSVTLPVNHSPSASTMTTGCNANDWFSMNTREGLPSTL